MKVSKATLVRTIIYLIIITNIVLQKFGLSPINISTDEEVIVRALDTIISLLVLVIGFWYNNSFTHDAIKADKLKEFMSDQDPQKVVKIINLLEELEKEEI